MTPPKGWYSRDYLSHFDRPGLIQAITFRLHDSMPAILLDRWERELDNIQPSQRDIERQKRIAAYLDAGYGECHLRDERIAAVVQSALLHFDGERYRLLSWVIMPNHVHVLAEMLEGRPLEKVIHSWKSWTAGQANLLLSRGGSFWCRDFHDRYIRDHEHFQNAVRYIHENPVKAGLCRRAEDWRWSSAWKERGSSVA